MSRRGQRYYRGPKDEAAEHERVWAEAQSLRFARPADFRGDWHKDDDEVRWQRFPSVATVGEPVDEDDRDLIDWWATEFPVGPKKGDEAKRCYWWDSRRATLWWIFTTREMSRISVDPTESRC